MSKFDIGTVFGSEELAEIANILASQQSLTRGPVLAKFESDLQLVTGADFAVACSSCTASLRIAFQALGLKVTPRPIITQVNSFWNTLAPLVEFGCPITFVDCEAGSLSICVDHLVQVLGDGALDGGVLVITEFGGHPSDHSRIRDLATRHKLTIVADCAHALGTTYKEMPIAAWVDIACFSFSTLKNISTLGEGGALGTNRAHLADMSRKLRETWPVGEYQLGDSLCEPRLRLLTEREKDLVKVYCRPGTATNSFCGLSVTYGTNLKLSAVQAAVGIVQLRRLAELNARRSEVVSWYMDELEGSAFVPVIPRLGGVSSWHLLNFIRKKSDFSKILKILDMVSTSLNFQNVNRYWPAFDLSAIRSRRIYKAEDFPRYMDVFFGRLLSLPINPKMTKKEVVTVAQIIREVDDA